jgi:predicted enzyme related to lactoylglutathione lyase
MAIVEKHKHGSFAWIELGTTDQTAAKAFYSGLFGWEIIDNQMGPDMVYTMFTLQGQTVAAAYTQGKDEKAMGVPPHWNLYIAVDDADAVASKVPALGGTVVMQPFDVEEHGRMAVVIDSMGASFCLWQARNHQGIGLASVEGTLCWADTASADQAASGKFYSYLFGYELAPGDGGYVHIKNDGEFIGGVQPSQTAFPPHWLIYLLVDNCADATEKARSLGATVIEGPMEIMNTGHMSVVADPQGAVFSLFQPFPRSGA